LTLRYLAHASLLVEDGGTRLVTDPWLDGPTYLSAWWHFPAPVAQGADLWGVDYVYLTHEHADHFHPSTLKALPRTTPILIGRFATPRFRDQLNRLGFHNVRELAHGRRVRLGERLMVTSYQYRADDTALVIETPDATILDLNDCLLRARALEQVLTRHEHIDLLAMSFANAEAYPIVYTHDDPDERPDWNDRSRFDDFLRKVSAIGPKAFTPFASMFSFLSPELFDLNVRIVTPKGLIDLAQSRARAGELKAEALPMNPGDRWDPRHGHIVESELDWSQKDALLRAEQARRSEQLATLASAERVPDPGTLGAAFASYFEGFARRIPFPLARKLELSVRFDVSGPAGGRYWLRFNRGRLDRTTPPSDDAYDARIDIADWPLWQAVTRKESWQSLGISCRFRVQLRPRAREREVWLWFLLYLDDLGYLSAWRLFTPRALSVFARRHREVAEYARQALGGAFVDASLRGKFGG
jgi:hypothetical protein